MNRSNLTTWLGATVIAISAAACSNKTDDKASEAARDAGNAIERAGEKTADAAREAGRETGNAMERAAEATGTAGREMARDTADAADSATSAAGAAIQTMDVKMALTADSRVDASDINVDTDHNTKTVTLKGHVPTAQQKTIAGQIATDKAVGYRVRNELAVGKR